MLPPMILECLPVPRFRHIAKIRSHQPGLRLEARPEGSGLLRRSEGPHEIDQIPALLLGETVLEAGHGAALEAVGEPPEQVAHRMMARVFGGEGGWPGVERCRGRAVTIPREPMT